MIPKQNYKLHHKYFESKIYNQQQLDWSTNTKYEILKQFINYLQQLTITRQSLSIIKLLVKRYGICIVIFLEKFYWKLGNQKVYTGFVEKESTRIKMLGNIIRKYSLYEDIRKIQFVYQFCDLKNGSIGVQESICVDKKKEIYVRHALKLEDAEQKVKNVEESMQMNDKIAEYRVFIKQLQIQWQQNKLFDQLMIRSLQKFIVSEHQLNKLMEGIQIEGSDKIGKGADMQQATDISEEQSGQVDYPIAKEIQERKIQHERSTGLMNQQISFQLPSSISFSQNCSYVRNQEVVEEEDKILYVQHRPSQQKINQQYQSSSSQEQQQQSTYSSAYDYLIIESLSKQSQSSSPIKKNGLNNNCSGNKIVQRRQMNSKKSEQHQLFQCRNLFPKSRVDKKKQSIDKYDQSRYLCCRKYFISGDELLERQSLTIAYIYAGYPFYGDEMFRIKEMICSMINGNGGHIYIGIEQNDGRYLVRGEKYCEYEKESFLRNMRQIGQRIEPDILTHKMYMVEFVPVKKLKKNGSYQFMAGQFVVKIAVRFGVRNEVYSFRENNIDYFPIRYNDKIEEIQGRKILEIAGQRMSNPLPVPIPLHSYQCEKPEIGVQVNSCEKESCVGLRDGTYMSKRGSGFLKYREKDGEEGVDEGQSYHRQQIQIYRPQDRNEQSQRKVIKIRNCVIFDAEAAASNKQKPVKSIPAIKNQLTSLTKPIILPIPKIIQSQLELKPSEDIVGYFYVVGLTSNQLKPALEKKNLMKIEIEERDRYKLVLKVFDEESNKLLGKLLKKIVEKYTTLNIQWYEIELGIIIKKEDIKKVEEELKKTKIDYFIKSQKILKFKYYGDSLLVFNLLKNLEIEGKFYKFLKNV